MGVTMHKGRKEPEAGVTEDAGLQSGGTSALKVFLFRKKEINLVLSESITDLLLNFLFFSLLLNSYLFHFMKTQWKTLIVQYVERYNYINISHI